MSTTESPARRYGVVQERDWVKNEIVKAVEAHRNAELDLYNETNVIHVSFELTTGIYDPESRLYIGTTTDHRTINLHIPKDGEVYALLPD